MQRARMMGRRTTDTAKWFVSDISVHKAYGSLTIDITVYVSVPLTGPDAVIQVYMFTGMPFPVKPGFFVHIKSEF
jgi:hypothetical protein